MKKFLFIIIAFTLSVTLYAQAPAWTKKAAKSLLTVRTFAADGTPIGQSNGFFVGDGGEALSSFTPFRGAHKAIAVDAQGKEFVVESILGANETYDVVKFRVNAKRTTPLNLASATPTTGETLWLLSYASKKTPSAAKGVLRKTEPMQTDYTYYSVSLSSIDNATGCPLLNADGDVVGLMQQSSSAKDTIGYAIDARFAAQLKIGGLSINDASLKQIGIKKALPDELDQALLTLYVAPSVMDSSDYVSFIDDFIAKFPSASDGYVARALMEVSANQFDQADADLRQAVKVADKKDEAHFSYAKTIFTKETKKDDVPYAPWSMDKAISEADEAYKINPQPVYRELKAQILFAQKKYTEAAEIYEQLTKTNLRSAQLFYAAALCKEQLRDTTAMLALLDSAVATFSKPYLKEAGPYILTRAQALQDVGRYREAVIDYMEYEKLFPTSLTDNFYYIREQAELEGHLYQQALNDIDKAISLNPTSGIYYAEKALVQLRVGLTDEAITSATESIRLAPTLSDGHLLLGLAQCIKGNKAEGIKNLNKAKELGNAQADALIEKYSE